MFRVTLPETNILVATEKLPKPNRKVVFQPSFFNGELLNFGGVISWGKSVIPNKPDRFGVLPLDVTAQLLQGVEGALNRGLENNGFQRGTPLDV